MSQTLRSTFHHPGTVTARRLADQRSAKRHTTQRRRIALAKLAENSTRSQVFDEISERIAFIANKRAGPSRISRSRSRYSGLGYETCSGRYDLLVIAVVILGNLARITTLHMTKRQALGSTRKRDTC